MGWNEICWRCDGVVVGRRGGSGLGGVVGWWWDCLAPVYIGGHWQLPVSLIFLHFVLIPDVARAL